MQPSVLVAPGRGALRRFAPPRGLALLLGIVAVLGVSWIMIVPPWQSPDEVAHFAYAQSLAENFALPGEAERPGISSDQSFADLAVGASRGAFYPSTSPPDWSSADYDAYLAVEHGADPPAKDNGSGPNPASQNPPLYYLYADIGYLIDKGGTTFGRLYAMRMVGVLLLLTTTIAAWLLVGETLGRRRVPQLAGAAVSGLLPMATFMSTSVNPDALLIALWTIALWLGARVINRRGQGADVIALCAVGAMAILTKATSYALVPPIALAIVIGWWRRPSGERKAALGPIAVGALALAVPVLAWLSLATSLGGTAITTVGASPAQAFNVRQFLSYVWQFYLPRLPFMVPLRTTPQLAVYDIWVRQGLGNFGWLDVFEPSWVYRAGAVIAAAIGVAAAVIVGRRGLVRRLPLLSFFASALLALLVLLHVSEYRVILAGGGQFNQGRYLLPIVGLASLAVAIVVRAVPQRLRAPACGLVLTALLVLQVISLTTIVKAYYL
jgi:4-amino-4-deoxy-L-arabinose transferase-like glycosyltransferase